MKKKFLLSFAVVLLAVCALLVISLCLMVSPINAQAEPTKVVKEVVREKPPAPAETPLVKIPETVKVQPGRLVLIEAETTCKSVAWILYSDEADLIPMESTKKAIFASPVPGTYRIVVVTCQGDVMSAPAVCEVIVGTPNPPVPPLVITPTTLPSASAGVRYNHVLRVTGGTQPYSTFRVVNFDAGTTGLDASFIVSDASAGTFTINGTPATAGTVSFGVQVVDSQQATLTQNYSVSVTAQPTDPFFQALSDAYQKETSATKAASKEKLASLYRQAAITTVNQPNLTNTKLLQTLHQTAQDLIDGDLMIVRDCIRVELNKVLPRTPNDPVTESNRPLYIKEFNMVSDYLGRVK